MSDLDDLVAAMVLGDPNETVPTDVVTAMAQAVLNARWIPCPHDDWITETNYDRSTERRTCRRCGGRLILEGGYLITEPEATDA